MMATIPTVKAEFFWTARRRRYWRSCRRKYFLYYYAASGGYDPGAPRPVQELYAAKKLITLNGYLRRLVNLALREAFYAPHDEENENAETPELFSIAARRAEWEFSRMLAGENPVVLLELLRSEVSPAAIHRELMEKLDALCTETTRSAWRFLSSVPHCDRRMIASPVEVAIAELKCYLMPVVAMRRFADIWLIEGTGCADDGDEIAMLGKFAAAKLWQAPPQQVKSFILSGESGTFTEVGNCADFSEIVRGIRQDVEEMTQVIGDDGSVREEDFPATTEHCETCAFHFFCRRKQLKK